MRYYSDPAFRPGAFTHPDASVRDKAIDLTKRVVKALGSSHALADAMRNQDAVACQRIVQSAMIRD